MWFLTHCLPVITIIAFLPCLCYKVAYMANNVGSNQIAEPIACQSQLLLYWERSGSVVECLTQDRVGRGFEPHRRHCVMSLSKNINPSLVLVQPRNRCPFITERLLMGRKESNQTKTQLLSFAPLICLCNKVAFLANNMDSDQIALLRSLIRVRIVCLMKKSSLKYMIMQLA